ncbi:hypothetical protein HYO65_gp145 [Tenacibaculum phage PTm1]|uniref:Uncharacterized protein n=2 Tax=Shirahamavirus PTm1 TaxID=2846435 RepID=A0A5S9BZ39_9CAUD|nr:hypothetical protein HYO65_gp145 [Tenacibaculum phage PTm1]BBI90537.1 hypothetical protein [Tenacibaculum phage PTm1]BBI90845.1 hypothetical protein [Tenacibaculum phage PTm5]
MKKFTNYAKLIVEDLRELSKIKTKLTVNTIVYSSAHGDERKSRDLKNLIDDSEIIKSIQRAFPKLHDSILNGILRVDRNPPKTKGKYNPPTDTIFGITDTKNDLNIVATLAKSEDYKTINAVIITVIKKKGFVFKNLAVQIEV